MYQKCVSTGRYHRISSTSDNSRDGNITVNTVRGDTFITDSKAKRRGIRY